MAVPTLVRRTHLAFAARKNTFKTNKTSMTTTGQVAALGRHLALLCAWVLAATPVLLNAQERPDSIPDDVTPERIAEGYELFQNNSCVNCHGEMGRGGVGGPSLRDREWLHTDGSRPAGSFRPSYEGILKVITWGVREEEIKAQGRPWPMDPRGGTDFDSEQRKAVAAYIWAQSYGLFEGSDEDRFVDLVLDRPISEVRELIMEYQATHEGAIPISARRFNRVANHAYNIRPRENGIAVAGLGLEFYPEAVDLRYTESFSLNGFVNFVRDDEEAVARAIESAETAIRMGPDHRNRVRAEENLRELRARR